MLKFRVASNPNVFSNRGGASGVAHAIPQLGKKNLFEALCCTVYVLYTYYLSLYCTICHTSRCCSSSATVFKHGGDDRGKRMRAAVYVLHLHAEGRHAWDLTSGQATE
jgi:hypothetical protein